MRNEAMDQTGRQEPGRWLEAAVREHEHALVRYAAGITGDLERARDVVQETFLKLLRAGPRGHAAEWLFTVCRNGALDVIRKEKRMSGLGDVAAAPGPASSAPVEQGGEMARVAAAVAHLPPNQREVIRLKFQNELAYKQIAAVTGLSESNVGFLIHTALKSLRLKLRAPRPEGELS